jgi:hypothetical protein
MNREIVKSIDSTDDVKGRKELLKFQEKINALNASDTEMSEYQLSILRSEYELILARIALEEAQKAKSQVTMSRDSEGSWGYVYTADEAA